MMYKWRFPKLRGTFLGAPIVRTVVFWGLYWALPIFLNSFEGGPVGDFMAGHYRDH